MLSESARPVGLVRAPGALSLSSINDCNIYRIHKPPAGNAYSDPCFQRAFPSPGLCEKVSANTLKHNGPANRDPSGSMSDPVPQPPLFRARLAFLWGPAALFSSAAIVPLYFAVTAYSGIGPFRLSFPSFFSPSCHASNCVLINS